MAEQSAPSVLGSVQTAPVDEVVEVVDGVDEIGATGEPDDAMA